MRAQDSLSETFAALADPTRRAILDRLMRGPASVNELAEPFTVSLPAISRHLKVLTEAGLITRQRDAQFRHCHLEAGPMKGASDWLQDYRRFWESRFDALEAHLQRKKKQPKAKSPPKPRKRRGAP